MTSPQTNEQRLLEIVLENPVCSRIVDRAGELGVQDWFLTAGGVFQTVWNHLDGRDLRAGIKDYDLFYFDGSDLSYDAEDRVIKRAATLFRDVNDVVEVRNEARVHLWYEDHFGVPAVPFHEQLRRYRPLRIDHVLRRRHTTAGGDPEVYAPYGFDDLFNMVLRPNPVMAPREVFDAKADRWREEWPRLTVIPWPER